VLDLFIPTHTRRLILYLNPINVRWGPDRLRAACERDLGVRYTRDDDGDGCITKKLYRGAFLLPAPAAGEKYAVIEDNRVSSSVAGSGALSRAPFRSEHDTHASDRFSNVVGPSSLRGTT